MSPRTLRDLAAAGLVPHHRIGKHYRFSRDDIAEMTVDEFRVRVGSMTQLPNTGVAPLVIS